MVISCSSFIKESDEPFNVSRSFSVMVKISVIVPVFKVEKYIRDCVVSILKQTCDHFECVFVDDCTPDCSMGIVDSLLDGYKGNIEFKIVRHERNKGLSAARNSGVKAATGDYLFFLDSDDELVVDAIERFVEAVHRAGEVDCLVGDIEIVGKMNYTPIREEKRLDTLQEILGAYVRGEWYVMACGKLIRRAFFVRNDLWFKEGLLHEDELFSFQLALAAKSMVLVNSPVYRYVMRGGSITTNKSEKNYRDFLWIISEKIRLTYERVPRSLQTLLYGYFVSLLFGYAVLILKEKGMKGKQKRSFISEIQVQVKNLCGMGRIVSMKHQMERKVLLAPYFITFVALKTYAMFR